MPAPNFNARRQTLKWGNENLRGRLSRSLSSASFICRSHHPNTWIGNANTAESIIEIFTSEKGKGRVTKSDAKIPIRLRPPPPHFRKIMLQFFYDRYDCIYARRYYGQIVWNACSWFPEIGTILRGGGQLPFGTFPKNHLIWLRDPSLRKVLLKRHFVNLFGFHARLKCSN